MSPRYLHRTAAFAFCLITAMGGCSGSEEPGEELEVAPFKWPFMGIAAGFTLVSRPDSVAPWAHQLPIEGFTHRWGTSARLRVEMREIANPPADGASRAYRLLEVLSTAPAEPASQFDLVFGPGDVRALIDGEVGSLSLKWENQALACPDAAVCADLDRRRRSTAYDFFVVTLRHPARADDPLQVVAVADYRP